MKTELLTVLDTTDKNAEIAHAADVICHGGLVVFPTETVYGIGGNGTDPLAAEAIYRAKGRPSDNPLILHISEPKEAEKYAYTNDLYDRLAAQFMPGPLTVILPKKDIVPKTVTGGLDTVALRCPAHPVAHALIKAAGVPIAAPSANLSGKPSPTLASHVVNDLLGKVDIIIDGGAAEVGLESTIVSLAGEKPTLLRPGAITYDALCLALGEVEIAPAVVEGLRENEKPLSPGMKYRHYAPGAPLTLLDGEDEAVTAFMCEAAKNANTGILCYDEEIPKMPPGAVLFSVGAKDDLSTQAHRLFAVLREADTNPNITALFAHLPPQKGLGLALYNRLIRAAAHTVKKV